MISVSDHALVRFLERVGGFDIEAMRAVLERSLMRAHNAAIQLGVSDYAIRADGHVYIVRDGRVTTILPELAVSERFAALGQRKAAK